MAHTFRRSWWFAAFVLMAGTGLALDLAYSSSASGSKYRYDDRRRLVERMSPTGAVTRYQYDRAGLLSGVSRRRRGRLTGWDYPAGDAVRFEYDLAGNRVAMRDSEGTTRYEYRETGELGAVTDSTGARVAYVYDAWRRVRSMVFANGGRVDYSYDLAGRLIAAATPQGTISYRYEPGRMTRTLPNGVSSVREFAAGRLAKLSHADAHGRVIGSFSVDYDADGRVNAVHESGSRSATTRYEYDPTGRLAAVVAPDGAVTRYEYDVVGNRLAETGPRGQIKYAYDPAGRLMNAGAARFTYDLAGNLTAKADASGRATYRYDRDNRLIEASVGGRTVRYGYNGDGDRVLRQAGDAVTHYVNVRLGDRTQVVAERNARGWAYFVHGDTRVARIGERGDVAYFLEGPLDSTRFVVDAAGAEVASYVYSPFGQPMLEAGRNATEFQFAGEAWDADTNLLYLRARYYEPSFGRFITADPAAADPVVPATFNRYAYANSDPVNQIDPSGLQSQRAEPAGPAPAQPRAPGAAAPDADRYAPKWINQQHKRLEDWALDVHRRHSNWIGTTAIAGAALDYALIEWAPFSEIETEVRKLADPAFTQGHPFKTLGSGLRLAYEASVVLPVKDPGVLKVNFSSRSPLAKVVSVVKGGEHWTQKRVYVPFGLDPRYPGSKSLRVPLETLDDAKDALEYGADLVEQIKQHPQVASAMVGGAKSAVSAVRRTLDPFNLIDRVGRFFPPPSGGGGPPTVGGVYLDRAATVIGQLGTIVGAVHDPRTGRMMLIGDRSIALPPMKPKYLAAALAAVYSDSPQELGMTIDPRPDDPHGPVMDVKYFGGAEATCVGWVMFEADRRLKGYSVGADNVSKETVTSPVRGYRSLASMAADGVAHKRGLWSRFWLVPEPITAHLSADGQAVLFDPVRMRVKTETMRWEGARLVPAGPGHRDDGAEAFAAHFTAHYDEFAHEDPIYGELRQVAAAVALAKWMHGRGVPLDRAFVDTFAGSPFPTPRTTPSARARVQRTSSALGRVEHFTIESFGGVEMVPLLAARQDADGLALRDAAVRGWTAAGSGDSESFPITLGTRTLVGVALPVAGQREPGAYTRADADLFEPDDRRLELPGLARYHNSLQNAAADFGRGWTLALPRLLFESATRDRQRQYLSVSGKPDTSVLVQRFTLAHASAFAEERFDEAFIDQARGRIGFRSTRPLAIGGVYPQPDGSYDVRFDGDRLARFDSRGRLNTFEHATGIVRYGFNLSDRLTSIRVERGAVTEDVVFERDAAGRIVRAVAADRTVDYGYDSRGDLVRVDGIRAFRYRYDALHRLVEIEAADAMKIGNRFDSAGHLLSQTSGEHRLRQELQGPADARVLVTTIDGVVARTFFDSAQRVIRTDDGLGRVETREFDTDGRIRQLVVALPTGGRDVLAVSADRQTVTRRDPRNVQTEYRLGPSGQLYQVVVNGRPTATYRYGDGRLQEAVFADGSREAYGYGGQGEVVTLTRIDARGVRQAASFEYDAAGNLTGVETPAGRASWREDGTRIAAVHGADAVVIGRDLHGRLEEIGAGTGLRTRWSRQADGALNEIATTSRDGVAVTRIFPDGTVRARSAGGAETRYTIDSRGLLTAVEDPLGAVTSYRYDDAGRLISARLANGWCVNYTRDGRSGLARALAEGLCHVQ